MSETAHWYWWKDYPHTLPIRDPMLVHDDGRFILTGPAIAEQLTALEQQLQEAHRDNEGLRFELTAKETQRLSDNAALIARAEAAEADLKAARERAEENAAVLRDAFEWLTVVRPHTVDELHALSKRLDALLSPDTKALEPIAQEERNHDSLE